MCCFFRLILNVSSLLSFPCLAFPFLAFPVLSFPFPPSLSLSFLRTCSNSSVLCTVLCTLQAHVKMLAASLTLTEATNGTAFARRARTAPPVTEPAGTRSSPATKAEVFVKRCMTCGLLKRKLSSWDWKGPGSTFSSFIHTFTFFKDSKDTGSSASRLAAVSWYSFCRLVLVSSLGSYFQHIREFWQCCRFEVCPTSFRPTPAAVSSPNRKATKETLPNSWGLSTSSETGETPDCISMYILRNHFDLYKSILHNLLTEGRLVLANLLP